MYRDKKIEKDEFKGEQMAIEFDIKKREKRVSNEMTFTDNDGDRMFSIFSSAKDGETREEPTVNMGDYLPKDICIRPEDISITRILNPEGGKVKINFKYKGK